MGIARTYIESVRSVADEEEKEGGCTLCFSLSSTRSQYVLLPAITALDIRTLGERRAHDDSANAGRGAEVSLAALSPAGGQVGVDLRHLVGIGGRGCAVVSTGIGCRRHCNFSNRDGSNIERVGGNRSAGAGAGAGWSVRGSLAAGLIRLRSIRATTTARANRGRLERRH